MKREGDHYRINGAQPAPTLDLFTWVEVRDEPPSAPVDGDAARLLDLLQASASGREAAIKADLLVQRLMLSGDNRLRALVQQLRNDGHLIGSGQDGYYMIDTAAEFERFLEALYLNRAEAIIDTANRLIDRGRSLFGEPAHQVKAVVLLRVDHNDLPMYLRGDTP